jgi:hypothetical protein
MPGSFLVNLGLAAEVVAVGFSAFTGYRAFSLSRALPGPIYRVRAEWTWIFSVIVIGVTGIFFIADLEIGGPFISQFLTGVNVTLTLFALVVLFAWVSSTIGVAFEQDFFHRDTLHWSSFRIPYWIGVTTAVLLSFFASGIEHCKIGCVDYVPYASVLYEASAVLVAVLMVYSSAILYVTAVRTPDATLERHFKWLGPFVAAAALALIILPIYGILVAFGSFFLFRASRFLSPAEPLSGVEIQGGAVSQEKRIGSGWQKYRTVSILVILISLVLAALILAEDGLLLKLGLPSAEGLTSVMIVYGVLVVLLITKTRLGFTLGLISSSLMFLVQVFNHFFAPPNTFISEADIAHFFPQGFSAYVLGLAPVYDQALCPLACPPLLYSAAVLFFIQVPLIAASYLGLRAERGASSRAPEARAVLEGESPPDSRPSIHRKLNLCL